MTRSFLIAFKVSSKRSKGFDCPFEFIESTNKLKIRFFQADCLTLVINCIKNWLYYQNLKILCACLERCKAKASLLNSLHSVVYLKKEHHFILMTCKRFLIIHTSNGLKISKPTTAIEYIKDSPSQCVHQLARSIAYPIRVIAFTCNDVYYRQSRRVIKIYHV